MARPGDRRQRYREACNIGGFILFVFGAILLAKEIYVLGSILVFFALLEIRDGQHGWKLKDEKPPWAARHERIDKTGG